MSPRIIRLKKILNYLKEEKLYDDFYKQVTSICYPTIFLESKEDFSIIIDIIASLNQDIKYKEDMVFIYCNNNKLLFKRIECQHILKNFIDRYTINPENFNIFQSDIIQNSSDDIFSQQDCLCFYINKKDAFSRYYNHEITDKATIQIIFEETIVWLNTHEATNKIGIKNIFLEQKENKYNDFIVYVCCNKNLDQKHLLELIDFLFHSLANGKFSQHQYKYKLPQILQYYKLHKLTPEKHNSKKIQKI